MMSHPQPVKPYVLADCRLLAFAGGGWKNRSSWS